MIRTRVGYAGGSKDNPTYYRLGDHTETLQIDYDPERISYQRLLELFWQEHDPTGKSWSTQYKAAIFYHDEGQRQAAVESRNRLAAKLGKTIHTEVVPFSRFYPAEGYHQKYYLRQNKKLLDEMQHYYPLDEALMNSTAAARINGYLGRNGSSGQLRAEMGALGLSENSRNELLRISEKAR